MSSFMCEICGAVLIDNGAAGYSGGCEHYPVNWGGDLSDRANKIRIMVRDTLRKPIMRLQDQYGCYKHQWSRHGLGYKCSECDYYTGTNDKLNKAIASLIPVGRSHANKSRL